MQTDCVIIAFSKMKKIFFLKTAVLLPKTEQLMLLVKIRPCFSYKKPTLNTFCCHFFSGQELGFVEVPQNISAAVGESLLLKCIANSVIKDCQWSWQSLEDGPNGTVTLVKEYPAFGDEVTNDCSVRFSSLLPEQEGYWICGIRGPGVTRFTNSTPAKLVVQRTSKVIIIFASEWTIEVQLYIVMQMKS